MSEKGRRSFVNRDLGWKAFGEAVDEIQGRGVVGQKIFSQMP